MPRSPADEEELYNYVWEVAPYDTPEGRASAPQWLLDLVAQGAVPEVSRALFPSAPEVRRQILALIAKGNEKYARPFDNGKTATASLIGTESWSDYGGVVLQMAILDTLISIEEKLGALLNVGEQNAAS